MACYLTVGSPYDRIFIFSFLGGVLGVRCSEIYQGSSQNKRGETSKPVWRMPSTGKAGPAAFIETDSGEIKACENCQLRFSIRHKLWGGGLTPSWTGALVKGHSVFDGTLATTTKFSPIFHSGRDHHRLHRRCREALGSVRVMCLPQKNVSD